ncbi:MAG: ATP-binding cassette domain-containing protein [Candidatus Pacearchaeota archaeon]|nr:ATP-binding cassette domain-containing protein [Candidatus Pacearchaeota archaeon]
MTDRIVVKNLWKEFNIGTKEKQTSLGKIKSMISGREQRKKFWALKDVSFTAKSGEVIGIVGDNGSGKSTLLRIIAGIYSKDKGKIFMKGNAILVSNDVGLNFSLNAIDNIFLGCSILGLNEKEIKQKVKDIISFAELENFANTKLYQYSTGMIARLTFSIAIHSINKNPYVLLIDENFSVGDEKFKKKCFDKVKEFKKNGSTILIVDHDAFSIKINCDRIIWLDKGQIKKEGGVKIMEEYGKVLRG